MMAHRLVWDDSARGTPSMHICGWCQDSNRDSAAESCAQAKVRRQKRARIAVGNADFVLHGHHGPPDIGGPPLPSPRLETGEAPQQENRPADRRDRSVPVKKDVQQREKPSNISPSLCPQRLVRKSNQGLFEGAN